MTLRPYRMTYRQGGIYLSDERSNNKKADAARMDPQPF
jgi:hypothetical protein